MNIQKIDKLFEILELLIKINRNQINYYDISHVERINNNQDQISKQLIEKDNESYQQNSIETQNQKKQRLNLNNQTKSFKQSQYDKTLKCIEFLKYWQTIYSQKKYQQQSKFVLGLKKGIQKSFVDQKIIDKFCQQLSQFHSFQLKKQPFQNQTNSPQKQNQNNDFSFRKFQYSKDLYKSKSTNLQKIKAYKSKTIQIIEYNQQKKALQSDKNIHQDQAFNESKSKFLDLGMTLNQKKIASDINTSSLSIQDSKVIKNNANRQFLLHYKNKLIAINPSNYYFQKNIIKNDEESSNTSKSEIKYKNIVIKKQKIPNKIILTSANINVFCNYIRLLILINKSIPIITTLQIYTKFKLFINFLWKDKKARQIFDSQILIIEQNCYYQNCGYMFMMKRNFMWQPQYDLIINHQGKLYLFEGAGIRDQKTIYAAWKKKIIEQPRYVQLVFNPDKYTWISIAQNNFCNRQIQLNKEIQEKDTNQIIYFKIFYKLRKCSIFKLLTNQEIGQLIQVGQIVDLNYKQTIYHYKMIIDHIYIVIEGTLLNETKGEQIQQCMCVGYEQWLQLNQRALYTCSVQSQKCQLLKISIEQLNFQLFSYISQMRKILHIDHKILLKENNNLYSNILKDNFYLKYLINLSKNKKSKEIIKTVQIQLNENKLKIPQNQWIILCRQNFLTLLD